MGLFKEDWVNPLALPKDPTAGRHGGNEESKAAWQRASKTAESVRQHILEMLALAGSRGLTCDEYAAKCGLTPNQVSGRFTQLEGTKKIRRNGKKRQTRTGSWAAVWVLG